jgi:hypothetical protein
MSLKKADTAVVAAFVGQKPPALVSDKNNISSFSWQNSKRDASGSPLPVAVKSLAVC